MASYGRVCKRLNERPTTSDALLKVPAGESICEVLQAGSGMLRDEESRCSDAIDVEAVSTEDI